MVQRQLWRYGSRYRQQHYGITGFHYYLFCTLFRNLQHYQLCFGYGNGKYSIYGTNFNNRYNHYLCG